MADVSHPLFARAFDRLSHVMERGLAARREQLLAGLRGRVIEIGCGNGINFAHYPDSVEQVVAIEPEPYLRARAQRAAARAAVRTVVCAGSAEALELGEESFDAAVASLVLCSVPDQRAALAELRRVLRPGGQLRLLEHVRSADPRKALMQRWVDRSGLWARLGGGCHCARDTVDAVREAGFLVMRLHRFDLGPRWLLTNPHVLCVATLPLR